MKNIIRGLIFISLFFVSIANALLVSTLYDFEGKIDDKSKNNRNSNIKAALKDVLVSVSGSNKILDNPEISKALNKSDAYVNKYSYIEKDDKTLNLKVSFDENKIDNLVRNAKFSVWGKSRPITILWVAIDEDSNEATFNDSFQEDLVTKLEEIAKRRGLPLVLPLMDLEDTSSVSQNDLWDLSSNKLKDASKRYDVEVVLGGRIFKAGGLWQSNWVLAVDNDEIKWDVQDNNIDIVLNKVVDELSQNLIKKYAVYNPSEKGKVVIGVEGIETLDEHARILKYLQNMAEVSNVRVVQVSGTKTLFSLTSKGGVESVQKSISLDRILSKNIMTAENSSILQYRLGT